MVLLILAGHFTSCESEDWILEVDCNECFDYKPDSALVILNLSFNLENLAIPLTVYRGDVGGEIEWEDTVKANQIDLTLAVGSTYAVRAKYHRGSQSIEVFDSDQMVLKDYGDSCGDPCYIIKGGIYELELPD